MPIRSASELAAGAPDKLSLLRRHLLFCDLPPATIERIGSYMKVRKVSRGRAIFRKGDAASGLIGVRFGSVKISVASADGRDIVLNIIQAGEIFGEIALLDGRPRTADATAMSNCELIVVERRDFIQFLRSQPDVALKFIEILCSRLRRTSEQVHDLVFLNLPTRLAKAVLRLSAEAAGAERKGKVSITQRELSQIVGSSRESTNKQLRAWTRQGWIRLDRAGVTVLAARELARIAEEGAELDIT